MLQHALHVAHNLILSLFVILFTLPQRHFIPFNVSRRRPCSNRLPGQYVHHGSHGSGNKQYNTKHMPMSYTTPKPRWWPSDLRGTDANSGDGWVGSCVAALPSGAGPKVGQDTRHSNRVFEHRCWPRRTGRVAATTLYIDGIPSIHVCNCR